MKAKANDPLIELKLEMNKNEAKQLIEICQLALDLDIEDCDEGCDCGDCTQYNVAHSIKEELVHLVPRDRPVPKTRPTYPTKRKVKKGPITNEDNKNT